MLHVFLEMLAENPGDPNPGLILADYLMEHDDPREAYWRDPLIYAKVFTGVSDNFFDGNGNGDGDGNGDGNGYGYGDGNGYGAGDGYGYGDGNGYGAGDGYGYGDGYGDGDGNGYGAGDGDGYGGDRHGDGRDAKQGKFLGMKVL